MIIYTLPNCPNCERVKEILHLAGYEFEERDMSTAESQTDMYFDGCFERTAPVLKVDDKYYNWEQLKDGKITEAL